MTLPVLAKTVHQVLSDEGLVGDNPRDRKIVRAAVSEAFHTTVFLVWKHDQPVYIPGFGTFVQDDAGDLSLRPVPNMDDDYIRP